MRYARSAALAAMLAVLVSGCGGPQPSSPAEAKSATPPVSPTLESLPTSRPSGPPSEPTDNDKLTGWIVGTVTAGGAGPCYGLVTDDGVTYALHSTAGIRLEKGARVRVKGTPAKIRIHCGPGRLLEMTAAEPLR
jgi:hypothetical protein